MATPDGKLQRPLLRRRPRAERPQSGTVFTTQGWARYATKELLRTSNAVDNVCHAVVAAKRCYRSGTISAEIRDLALTVAIIERSLFAYADRIRSFVTTSNDSSHSSELNVSNRAVAAKTHIRALKNHHSIDASITPLTPLDTPESAHNSTADLQSLLHAPSDELPTLADKRAASNVSLASSASSMASETERSINDIRSVSPSPEPLGRTRPVMFKHYGGVVSLLALFFKNLTSVRSILHSLVRWSSLTSFVCHSRALCVGTTSASFLSLMLAELIARKNSRFQRLFRTKSLFRLLSMKYWIVLLVVWPYLSLLALHRRLRWLKIRRLRELHREMLLILRLWSTSMSVLEEEKVTLPISRWMLEMVPPPGAPFSMISSRLAFFHYTVNVLHATAFVWHVVSSCRWYGIPVAVSAGAFFILSPRTADSVANELLTSPDLRAIKAEWAYADAWLTKRLSSISLRLVNRPQCYDRFVDFDSPSGHKHKVRIVLNRPGTIIGDMAVNKSMFGTDLPPVALLVGAGSWICDVIAADIGYMAKWAHVTGIPIVRACFSLQNDHTYPEAVAESFALFKWIASGGLGFVPPRIAVCGDGNGGTLAASICIQAALVGFRRPDHLSLFYPVLNLRPTNMTPSRCAFPNDPIVPISLLQQSKSVYQPFNSENDLDLCASPMTAPLRLLAGFPPTSIMVGGVDPLFDESIEFAQSLSSIGVYCQLKVYPSLPHGFLGFSLLLPTANSAIDLAAEWLSTALGVKSTKLPTVHYP